jgi:hypothetical protein
MADRRAGGNEATGRCQKWNVRSTYGTEQKTETTQLFWRRTERWWKIEQLRSLPWSLYGMESACCTDVLMNVVDPNSSRNNRNFAGAAGWLPLSRRRRRLLRGSLGYVLFHQRIPSTRQSPLDAWNSCTLSGKHVCSIILAFPAATKPQNVRVTSAKLLRHGHPGISRVDCFNAKRQTFMFYYG